MAWKFTHAADAAAKIAVQNALFSLGPLGRKKLSSLVMPWCTYTDPEVAHVGLYAADASSAGIAIDTYDVPLAQVNRAVTDGEEEGLVRVHVRRGTRPHRRRDDRRDARGRDDQPSSRSR